MGIVRHATASLVTLLAFPNAASSESTWTGPMYVETVTKACVDVGIKPGTRMFVNLSPASLNTESQLSFVARPKVHQIYGGIADFSQGTAYDQTFVIDGKLEVQGLLSLPLPTKFVTWAQTPASFAGYPAFIALTVKLTNFIGKKGCTAKLRGNLALTSEPPI